MSSDRDQRENAIETLQTLADFNGSQSTARAIKGDVAEKWTDQDVLAARKAAGILGPREAWRALALNPENAPAPSEMRDPQQTLGSGGELGVSSEARAPDDTDTEDGAETVQRAFGGSQLQDRYMGEFTPSLTEIPANVDGTYTIAIEEPDRIYYEGPVVSGEWDIQPSDPEMFAFNRWYVGVENAEGGRWELIASNVQDGGEVSGPTMKSVLAGDIFGRDQAVERLDAYLTDLSVTSENKQNGNGEEEPDFGGLEPEVVPQEVERNPNQQTIADISETTEQRTEREQRERRREQQTDVERGQLRLGEQQDRLGESFGGGSGFAGGGSRDEAVDESPDTTTQTTASGGSDGGEGMSLSDFGSSTAGGPDLPRGPAGGDEARAVFNDALSIDPGELDSRGEMGRLLLQMGWAIHELQRGDGMDPNDVSRANSAVQEVLLEARERNAISPSDRNRIVSAYTDLVEAERQAVRESNFSDYNSAVSDAFGVRLSRTDGGESLSDRLSGAFDSVREMGFGGQSFPDRD